METISDIIKEMREQRQFLGSELCAWADRIEAAYNFEKLEMNAEKGWYCYHYKEQTKKTIALEN